MRRAPFSLPTPSRRLQWEPMKSQTDASVHPKDLDLIPFDQVPDVLPRRRGRKHHKSTVYRWADVGVDGVRLRYLQVAGQKCTTRDWLMEFFHKITARKRVSRDSPGRRSTARVECTRQTLSRSGILDSQRDCEPRKSPAKDDMTGGGGAS